MNPILNICRHSINNIDLIAAILSHETEDEVFTLF